MTEEVQDGSYQKELCRLMSQYHSKVCEGNADPLKFMFESVCEGRKVIPVRNKPSRGSLEYNLTERLFNARAS